MLKFGLRFFFLNQKTKNWRNRCFDQFATVVTLLPLLTASNAIISAAFANAISAFCSIIFGSNVFRALNATWATVFLLLFETLFDANLEPNTI